MQSLTVTIEVTATEQHFPVVLFIVLSKGILTCKYGGEMLWPFEWKQYFSIFHLNLL